MQEPNNQAFIATIIPHRRQANRDHSIPLMGNHTTLAGCAFFLHIHPCHELKVANHSRHLLKREGLHKAPLVSHPHKNLVLPPSEE